MARNFCGIVDFNGKDRMAALNQMSSNLNIDNLYRISYPNIRSQAQFCSLYGSSFPEGKSNPILKTFEDKISIVSYGYLINAKSLCKQLDIDTDLAYNTDGIILASYLKWGKSCSEKLLGDWSFVLWDKEKQEVIMSMSQTGEASIYYTIRNGVLYFSSLLTGLVGIEEIPLALDETKLFTEFCEYSESEDRTFYKDIHVLHLGQFITYNKDKHLRKHIYWDVKNLPETNYKNDSEYIDGLLSTYKDSVKSILDLPVNWVGMLSGGLDSSSISYLSCKELQKQNKSLDVFSYTQYFKEFDKLSETKRSGDETPFIKHVAAAIPNLNVNYVQRKPNGFLSFLNTNFETLKHPFNTFNLWWLEEIFKEIKVSKIGNGILGGEGGNGTLSYEGFPHGINLQQLRDDCRRGLDLSRLNLSEKTKMYSKASLGSLKNYIKNFPPLRSYIFDNYLNQTTFINKDFYNRVGGKDIMEYYKFDYLTEYPLSLEYRYRQYNNSFCRIGIVNELASKYDLIATNVPRTVNMIGYTSSLPNHIFNRFGEEKYLFKQTFKDKLPKEVVFAQKKALQASDIIHILRNDMDELHESISKIKNSSLCQSFLDMEQLDGFWKKLEDPNYFSESFTYEVFRKTTSFMIANYLAWIEEKSLLS